MKYLPEIKMTKLIVFISTKLWTSEYNFIWNNLVIFVVKIKKCAALDFNK